MSEIKGILKEEMPREKLLKFGVENLTNVELLAILLRTGTKNKNVLELSREILEVFNVDFISRRTLGEITKFKGINIAKACIVLATFELARRLGENNQEKIQLSSSKQLYEYVNSDFSNLTIEKILMVLVDSKNKLIKKEWVSEGGISNSSINPRKIAKSALIYDVSGLFLIHNHPSGDQTPSRDDIEVTKDIKETLEKLGIRFLDHIIVGNHYYSMYDNDIL